MKNLFLVLFCLHTNFSYGKNVVFWLSIDGLKPEYLEKAKTPHLHELMRHSLVTKRLVPVFPSITFPSHCSQATGVKVKTHGIPFNSFYDQADGSFHTYPSDSALLTAEPIWQTAKKSGKRSAVLNWPLSFKQTGEFKSDYFNESYEKELNDEERIDRALKLWEKDQDLDLIMAYIVGPDSVAHKLGPNHEKVLSTVEEIDRLVGKIQDKVKLIAASHKENQYYLLLTTDHGMTEVKFGVNFSLLNGLGENSKVKEVTGGPIGHIFLNGASASERLKIINRLKRKYAQTSFAKMYEKHRMPESWGYDHPTRVGDLVVVLDPGYAFVLNAKASTVPIQDVGGPIGMHGYLPHVSPDMYGFMLLWRYPLIPSKVEITSSVDSLDLHATVAKLLGIRPSVLTQGSSINELKHFSN